MDATISPINGPSGHEKEWTQSTTNIKLCGYLKKKRNKVGGWRKMWFVLQDKLLLSYGSKEEYDNKLVSFKDVLNLVPGTLVRPLEGCRFTIETTSHAMYTFHCEDQAAYREWITMLLYSLANQTSTTSTSNQKLFGFTQRFANISLDNMPSTFQRSMVPDNGNSTSSIHKQQSPTTVGSTVDVDSTDYQKRSDVNTHSSKTTNSFQNKCSSPHFRLHDKTSSIPSAMGQTQGELPDPMLSVKLINQMFTLASTEKIYENFSKSKSFLSPVGASNENRLPENFRESSRCASCPKESESATMVRDSIYRMSIKGSNHSIVENSGDAMEKHNQRKLSSKTTMEEVVMKKQPASGTAANPDNAKIDNALVEPVYAVVDLKNKYAHRMMRNLELNKKRCNSYDSIAQDTHPSIYTPMELEMREKSRISTCTDEDIDGIYEDAESFPKNDTSSVYAGEDQENIYEPINVTTTEPNSFWGYFNRLKINSLLQITRIRKRDVDHKCSNIQYLHSNRELFDSKGKGSSSNRKSIKFRMRKLCFREYEPKPFFKHCQQPLYGPPAPVKKWKSRWKSVKLGSKNQNVLNDVTKSEKRFFGSLPHFKKTRISIFSNQHLLSSKEASVIKSKTTVELDLQNMSIHGSK